MVIEEEFVKETESGVENDWFPQSQGVDTRMELTRVVQALPRKSSRAVPPYNVTMVLTQPAAVDIRFTEKLESEYSEAEL